MKIAIFGGTFDPIHLGHVQGALNIYEEFKLDKIYFVPAYIAPLKDMAYASINDRVNMVYLATQDYDYFEVSTYEIYNSRSNTYTYNTVNYFSEKFSEDEIYLIIGYDQYLQFDSWKNTDQIFEKAKVIVMPRGDESGQDISDDRFLFSKMQKIDISSTMIRSKIAKRKSFKDFLDKKVYDYIVERELYYDSDDL